jgi:1-phosphofructokinase
MIYSLTISPCIDYNLDLEENDIRVGGVNRPVSKGFSLGGKGITVSRMLNNLKVKNIPLDCHRRRYGQTDQGSRRQRV